MVAILGYMVNGSYAMAGVKPIKSLELHYTIIQFLIMDNIKTWNPGTFAVPIYQYVTTSKYDNRLLVVRGTPGMFKRSSCFEVPKNQFISY